MKLNRFLGATALVGVLAFPAAALAQATTNTGTLPAGTPDQSPATEQTDNSDGTATGDQSPSDVVVTGSRIRSANLESASPITTVTPDQIFSSGKVSLGDKLNELPQLRNTYNQQNSTRFLGTRGLSLIDLYGLGTQRTLVVVNGRRHVAGDILNNGVSVDINTLPTDLIERIDVLTGGASAVYGSDAIAGVTNFVLKDDYDGVQLRGRAGLNPQYRDAGSQYVSLLAGKNFGGGRGNLAVDLEYQNQSAYYASDRKPFRQVNTFVTVDSDITTPADDVYDRAFFNDVRSAGISLGGQLGFRYANTAGSPCGNDALGASFTCAYLFQPDGSLIPQTGLRVGLGPVGSFIGGNGYVGREGQLLTFQPNLKRYSANLIGHYEIADALVPFVEASFTRTEALGSVSGPFFSQGQTLSDSITVPGLNDRSYGTATGTAATATVNREGIRLDNPYLSAQARAIIAAQLNAAINSGVNPNTGAAFGTTAAGVANRNLSLAQVAAGTYRFSLRRNYIDLGIRDESLRRDTYRIVGGIRGTFNDDWSYELSANYGEFKERNFVQSNVNRQRFLLANDTVRNAAGQIVCRAQVDPNYAKTIAAASGTDAQKAAILAADVAACVPLNPFGQGSVSAAARNYLTVPSFAEGKITQFDALGFVSGDLSQLFSLPGGPIAFSLGGEYRRETNFYDLDDLTQAGYAFYNAIPTLNPPTAFKVKEAFGEVKVPLLADITLIHELTLSGSGRVADYKGAVGTVYAYSGDAIYSPFDGLRFRGSYSRSVRAPNLSELYSAQSQNFAPGFVDPCSARNIATGAATRAANCAAAGRPANYDYVYSSSLEFISGGNPGLKEETSDSYTFGFVLTPRAVPGLSISSDYYDIKVKNVIASIGTAQQIANLCYDSATINNPFCALFQRAGASGGPRGEEPFRILEGTLLQSQANFAKLKVRGVDTNISYAHTFPFGAANISASWTRALQNDSFTNPADPTFIDRLLAEPGNPKNRIKGDVNLKTGMFGLHYGFRYIGSMYINTYEDYNALNGGPPQNPDYAPIKLYPATAYHDVAIDANINEKFTISFGIDNVGGKIPPLGSTGVGGGTGIYDVLGRYAHISAVAKF